MRASQSPTRVLRHRTLLLIICLRCFHCGETSFFARCWALAANSSAGFRQLLTMELGYRMQEPSHPSKDVTCDVTF